MLLHSSCFPFVSLSYVSHHICFVCLHFKVEYLLARFIVIYYHSSQNQGVLINDILIELRYFNMLYGLFKSHGFAVESNMSCLIIDLDFGFLSPNSFSFASVITLT